LIQAVRLVQTGNCDAAYFDMQEIDFCEQLNLKDESYPEINLQFIVGD